MRANTNTKDQQLGELKQMGQRTPELNASKTGHKGMEAAPLPQNYQPVSLNEVM